MSRSDNYYLNVFVPFIKVHYLFQFLDPNFGFFFFPFHFPGNSFSWKKKNGTPIFHRVKQKLFFLNGATTIERRITIQSSELRQHRRDQSSLP